MPWVEPIARRAAWITIAAAVMAFLWVGKDFAFPLALAVLLAFTLSPVVEWLDDHLHSRLAGVVIACAVGLAVLLGIGVAAGYQLVDFVGALPDYRHNITQKLNSARGDENSIWYRATAALGMIEKEASAPSAGATAVANTPLVEKVMPVVIRSEHAMLDQVVVVTPAFHYLATAAMVAILVVLLLLYTEDLRDRIIVLAGTQQISMTAQALEEAGSKVGRYLLMLTIVNAGFGLAVAMGLWAIGIPNPFLLGVLAGVLRYVPLIGAWLGATLPVLLAIAVMPGWHGVIYTFGLFLAIEIACNFLIEPFIYGHSTGISSVAVIVAILFWTLVWGAVGLLLAVPITVCIVVFGKYVEPLRVFYVMLSDEPMLAGERRLYHRLITGDVAAADEIVQDALKATTPVAVYDDLLLPALRTARSDHVRGVLSDQKFNVVNDMLETLMVDLQSPPCEDGECTLATVPVQAEDRVAARMAASALAADVERPVPVLESSLATDLQAAVEKGKLDLLLLVSTTPEALVRARLLNKALSRRLPKLRIYLADLGDVATGAAPKTTSAGVAILPSIAAAVEKVGGMIRGQVDVATANETAVPASVSPITAVPRPA